MLYACILGLAWCLQITLIGDLDEGLVQKYILQYLGTLNPQSCFEALLAKTVEESRFVC